MSSEVDFLITVAASQQPPAKFSVVRGSLNASSHLLLTFRTPNDSKRSNMA